MRSRTPTLSWGIRCRSGCSRSSYPGFSTPGRACSTCTGAHVTGDQVTGAAELLSPPDPQLPLPYRVASSHAETHDSFSLRLEPVHAAVPAFEPGQFTMLYRRGVGEIAISVSGDPAARDGALTQTIR